MIQINNNLAFQEKSWTIDNARYTNSMFAKYFENSLRDLIVGF